MNKKSGNAWKNSIKLMKKSGMCCDQCDMPICDHTLAYIRSWEEVLVASKTAIENLEAASVEREGIIQTMQEAIKRYRQRYGDLEEKNRVITGEKIKGRMDQITLAEERMVNRDRLIQ